MQPLESCPWCHEGFNRSMNKCCRCPTGRKRARSIAIASAADRQQEERAMAARGRAGGMSKLGEMIR